AGLLSLVALIVLALVLGRTSSVSGLPGNALRSPAPSAITDRITSIPAEEFAAVGDGGVDQPLRPITGQQPLKGAGGRPLVLFVGADYCPFCAAERWSLVAALSRFGQVSGLQLTSSATNDTDPNTDTLELSHLTFSSDVLDVQAVELADRDGNPYQTPNADQGAVYAALGGGTIPFLDIGNVYLGATAGYDASILHGLTWDQIAGKLLDANDPVTKAIVGNANRITAAICRITQGRPAAVCQAAPIPRLMGQLPAS
ncbi:MAG TPA: DUF929 family protein, partial [Candidatus Dormibacteraeota bacterium]|nr:DUF929 family protein [Candidatus Dormibacteraeota bacterium]